MRVIPVDSASRKKKRGVTLSFIQPRKSRRIEDREKRIIESTGNGPQQVQNTTPSVESKPSTKVKKVPKVYTRAPPKPDSTRNVNINVNSILFGKNLPDDCGLLGKQVEKYGKAAVIEDACYLSGHSSTASFNKYSGICEWANKCFFLWVNFDAPNTDTVNEFLENARFLTWFGGAKMQEHSPILRKLISVSQEIMLDSKRTQNEDSKDVVDSAEGANDDIDKSVEPNFVADKKSLEDTIEKQGLITINEKLSNHLPSGKRFVDGRDDSLSTKQQERNGESAEKAVSSFHNESAASATTTLPDQSSAVIKEDSIHDPQSNTSVGAIILWCRKYDRATKRFQPYTCLGRVGYHRHYPDTLPVKCVWKLLDYDRLIECKEDGLSVLEAFTGISLEKKSS